MQNMHACMRRRFVSVFRSRSRVDEQNEGVGRIGLKRNFCKSAKTTCHVFLGSGAKSTGTTRTKEEAVV